MQSQSVFVALLTILAVVSSGTWIVFNRLRPADEGPTSKRAARNGGSNRVTNSGALIAVAGLCVLIIFGGVLAFSQGLTDPLWNVRISLLMISVMVAAASVGGLIGFLFGIPRFDIAPARQSNGARLPDQEPALTSNATDPGTSSGSGQAVTYRPSTNLDEIADWFTKIIVGVGLTQLSKIGTGLDSITERIQATCPNNCGSQASSGAIIVYSVILGFLLGYLWTRLYYNKVVARSDRDVRRVSDGKVEQSSIDNYGSGGRSRNALADQTSLANSDPNKNQFGGSPIRNGRELEAVVEPAESRVGWFRVLLRVKSTNPERPMPETVTFHLHPTFKLDVVRQPVVAGVAELIVIAYGAFTVGVSIDTEPDTRLELDLATLTSAPTNFRIS